ncbi:MAG: hypothetical protein ACOCQX_00840 [Candidatus Nanoarchaeia archaeon]
MEAFINNIDFCKEMLKIYTLGLSCMLLFSCSAALNEEKAKRMVEDSILKSEGYNMQDLELKKIEELNRWEDGEGNIFPLSYNITYSIKNQNDMVIAEVSAIVAETGIKQYNFKEIVAVNDFKSCVDAGFEVLEPDCKGCPKQCITPDEKIFFEYPPEGLNHKNESFEKICVDKCGDGICQEVVCMGEGCPCPENKNNCPEDC